MGVYIFLSIWEPIIKIGHYKGENAWFRIAPNRGFYSASPPSILGNRIYANDFELCYWLPMLGPKDEKRLQYKLDDYKISAEWFRSEALTLIPRMVPAENLAKTCSKEDAMNRFNHDH